VSAPRELEVAVLGAGGTIAPAIVRDLAESEEIAAMRLLDLDEARAAAVAETHGGGKASAGAVDARYGLAAELETCDLLVNSASYRVNIDAMRACLSAGCHYLDLGGLYRVTGDQLELDADFRRAGLLALLGMGSSPGKTNVMATAAVRALSGAAVSELHVVAAGRDLEPPEGFSVPYALRTLVDELTIEPVVVRDGEVVEVAPLTDGGWVALPEPVGTVATIYTLHSELRTFPESFGCREASFRLSLAPAVLERVRALTGASDTEIDSAAREALPPSARTVSVHRVAATGGDGRTATATSVTRPVPEWGLGGGVVSTAAPAAAAARLIARGVIDSAGALPPERCVEPGDLFPELERRNAEIRLETAGVEEVTVR
jgi:saccharopine dehydrogenase (NAD+, L-lysine-forming)